MLAAALQERGKSVRAGNRAVHGFSETHHCTPQLPAEVGAQKVEIRPGGEL